MTVFCRRLTSDDMPALAGLHVLYKQEIGEAAPDESELRRLRAAIAAEEIMFFGAWRGGELLAICSVVRSFSTFCYNHVGTFEDFYILPQARHQGIARQLASFAWQESGVKSLTVGCALCDRAMYEAIGFRVKLGDMLAWDISDQNN